MSKNVNWDLKRGHNSSANAGIISPVRTARFPEKIGRQKSIAVATEKALFIGLSRRLNGNFIQFAHREYDRAWEALRIPNENRYLAMEFAVPRVKRSDAGQS